MTKNDNMYYKLGKLGLVLTILWLTWTFSQPIFQLYKDYNQPYAFTLQPVGQYNNINYSLIGIKPQIDKETLYYRPQEAAKIELYYSDPNYKRLNEQAIAASSKLEWLFIAIIFIIVADAYYFGMPSYIKKIAEGLTK